MGRFTHGNVVVWGTEESCLVLDCKEGDTEEEISLYVRWRNPVDSAFLTMTLQYCRSSEYVQPEGEDRKQSTRYHSAVHSTVQYSTQYRYREDQLQPPDAEVAATVESFSLHPSYVARDLLGTDVAVLRLKQAVQFSHKVRPICLPSDPEETHDNKEQCFKKVHPKDRNHGEGPY